MTMQADLPRDAAFPAATSLPHIRDLSAEDIIAALREGWDDFSANPTHYIFIGLIFPVIGAVLIMIFSGVNLMPLVFPALTGFALVGPFAALGVYEISKRREQGLEPSWDDARQVLHSPAIGAVLRLGLLLCAIFAAWMAVAYVIYGAVMGPYTPLAAGDFMQTVLTTPKGWMLILIGNAIGFFFAAGVLAISAISFPLLLDRPQTDVGTAIRTSVAVMRANPKSIAVWGLIVAALLIGGTALCFVGLAVTVPLLGHATWHLYRKAIA